MSGCAACSWEVQVEDTFCPHCGAPVVDPLIGAVVGDRYRVVSRIGVGGMGAVYRAEHTMMRKDLAIKVLLPEFGGKDEFVRRFEREAESASRLQHPNIITVTDFGRTAEGSLFLAMEFLAGESLSSVIKAGPVPRARALHVIRQILRGLDHAHAAGIVHRDLKPDNIMLVERDGQADVVKILDFGIAKVTEPFSGTGQNRATGATALTQAGMIFGTPEYLSPEQALAEVVDARADIYAAGVILFEMLAGRKPFESDDKVKLISMHLAHAPPRLREANPNVDVPVALEQVVLQALEKSRDNRFLSAEAFLQALDDAEALAESAVDPGATVAALGLPAPVGPLDRLGRFLASRGALVLAVAVLAVGGGVVYKRGAARRALVSVPARPAPPPPALADRLKKIESLLESGNTREARLALEHELSERPRDGRIRYMLGRVAFSEGKHAEALAHYREAVGLDAGFRGDPVLLDHLQEMFGESRNVDAALDLAIEKIGAPAADLLLKVANESPELARRQRAVAALEEMGKGDKVDRVALASLQLKKARGCEEKKVFVEKLRDLGDPRALPSLRELRGRSFGGLFRLGGANTRCMRKELPAAIKELEAKATPDADESDSNGSRPLRMAR
ncbi:MAG TPA: protein kinase [Minicystis sp.]|jgi:serine/threonine-protein kinase|nr:protein kinase [Minicystis sp.]